MRANGKAAEAINILQILAIGVGLSMDALAVSVAAGLSAKRMRLQAALRMSIAFGLFQALMPIAGWRLGTEFRRMIEGFDHWIAFGLLVAVGGKMIYESFQLKSEEERAELIGLRMLFVLALATSIDALAVGLSLSMLGVPIVAPSLIIGCVTFCLCFAGVFVGAKFGHLCETKLEVIGGLILIGIGFKILADHFL